jgi:hypothetical protein
MRRISGRVLTLGFVCFLCGCSSGRLDKKTAAEHLASALETSSAHLFVETGVVGLHCSYLDDDGTQQDRHDNPNQSPDLVVALRAGYVTADPQGPDSWRISLTPKGQALVNSQHLTPIHLKGQKGCNFDQWYFIIANPKLVNVIDVSSDTRLAEVVYDWQWVPTDVGRALQRNGDLYSKLTENEREALHTRLNLLLKVYGLELPIPVPSEDIANVVRSKKAFKKYDSGWRTE